MGTRPRSLPSLLCVFALLLSGGGLAAQSQATVAVLRLVNTTGLASTEQVCAAATTTMVRTLRALGSFTVTEAGAPASLPDDPSLARYAVEGSLDYIISGSVQTAKGGFVCSISVFDRAKGRSTITKTSATVPALGLFDAVDDLATAVLEAMTGLHLAFGRLDLKNTGEKASYEVFVDAFSQGRDLASLPKVLAGRHLVRIVQQRMLGEVEVARLDLVVAEGGAATFSFALPYLTDQEKAALEDARAKLESLLSGPSSLSTTAFDNEMKGALGAYKALLGDVSYSPRLGAEKATIQQFEARWKIEKCRLAIEEGAWKPSLEPFDEILSLWPLVEAKDSPASLASGWKENAQLLALFLELDAARRLGANKPEEALERYRAILALSRFLPLEAVTGAAGAVGILSQAEAQPAALQEAFASRLEYQRRFDALRTSLILPGRCLMVSTNLDREAQQADRAKEAMDPGTFLPSRRKFLLKDEGYAPLAPLLAQGQGAQEAPGAAPSLQPSVNRALAGRRGAWYLSNDGYLTFGSAAMTFDLANLAFTHLPFLQGSLGYTLGLEGGIVYIYDSSVYVSFEASVAAAWRKRLVGDLYLSLSLGPCYYSFQGSTSTQSYAGLDGKVGLRLSGPRIPGLGVDLVIKALSSSTDSYFGIGLGTSIVLAHR